LRESAKKHKNHCTSSVLVFPGTLWPFTRASITALAAHLTFGPRIIGRRPVQLYFWPDAHRRWSTIPGHGAEPMAFHRGGI
jgi:hypothetical protein